jgi:heme oxygenase
MASLHQSWVAAKKSAAKRNNGKEIKLKDDSGFGKALDKYEMADRKYAENPDKPADWIKAAKAYYAAAEQAEIIGRKYKKELGQLSNAQAFQQVNHEAFRILDEALGGIILTLNKVTNDANKKQLLAMVKRKEAQL